MCQVQENSGERPGSGSCKIVISACVRVVGRMTPAPKMSVFQPPRTGEYIRLHGQKRIKITDGVEFANGVTDF